MITFFFADAGQVLAVHSNIPLQAESIEKLQWLFDNAKPTQDNALSGTFIGPRREMLTPWSTNAVEITQNMGVEGILRIELFQSTDASNPQFDPMLSAVYDGLDQDIFTINKKPEPILAIDDIASFNRQEGLALSDDEVTYLEGLSKKLNRKLTDSEIFGFSQVNSEHCRHKIFNGRFVIDDEEMEFSLFQLIKKTTQKNPNRVISAYKDNCAFIQGPMAQQFAPVRQNVPAYFKTSDFESVISIKAETHNFPTTVEPFNGAATGTGGEIRDRIAGGKGAIPLAGTAVYMTSYPRLDEYRTWENSIKARNWLYQSPANILIKASNGASDFGNKFGQPLICGSVLTFEHCEDHKTHGFDKVIMLAGGIGYGKKKDSLKDKPEPGDAIILMGGDNYRIGMGGGAVSSVATGEFANAIELNAVQRSNPEMQKRVCNAIRALAESETNPVVSIHDHGAGGHLNCLSELVEDTGGSISIEELPVGDPTLSDKEIIGNESQERMGLVLKTKDVGLLREIAERERAPMYEIGVATGDMNFSFGRSNEDKKPMDLQLSDMFGNPPKTLLQDKNQQTQFADLQTNSKYISKYLTAVLQLEAVACKDWLTNKVDRSVNGRVAKQQTCGALQLPLNNCGVNAIDFIGEKGIATSIGHAPVAAMANAAKGSRLAIAESLTNIIFAPIEGGLKGISLSANWMWPCKNDGEDARLYNAVKAASDFALALGINIPTGKDSLSMTQKYGKDEVVYAPGTVIISAVGEVTDIRKNIEPVIQPDMNSEIWYIDLSRSAMELGGSSLAQSLNKIGAETPDVADPAYFLAAFNAIQQLVEEELVLAGHDISSGGMITCLLEMCFAQTTHGMQIDLTKNNTEVVKLLFSENPGVILQVKDIEKARDILAGAGIQFESIGKLSLEYTVQVKTGVEDFNFDLTEYRQAWYRSSTLLNNLQTANGLALVKAENYVKQALNYQFKPSFNGSFLQFGLDPQRQKESGIKAAIIREKGVNGDREMAWAMHLAGMDVKDVHMTDLISGRETLQDIQMIVFVGGFSNSDVLGSAKGWAGAFLYNPKAKKALDDFYNRKDTLSLGVCNGCQLMIHLGLVTPDHDQKPKMLHNDSNKFESIFLNVDIPENNSVMLQSLAGSKLGIWVAHGEGKFSLPKDEKAYNIAMKYSQAAYPGNPNGSDHNTAALCSADGRHLVMMPHLERSIYPWNWPYYPADRKNEEVSPWIEAFVNARNWLSRQ